MKLLDSVEGLGESLRDDLRELDSRGMVSRSLETGRQPTYSIPQPKLQEIILRDLPPAEERRLHGLLADSLAAFHEEDLSPVHEELAFHRRSDDPGKAMKHLLAAGEALQKIHAHEKALEHFQQGLQRLQSVEDQPSSIWRSVKRSVIPRLPWVN